MTFGTFDLFHKGHEFYLKQSQKLGDKLIVIIARDTTVKEIKKFRPADNEQTRLNNVKKTNIAHQVILGNKTNKMKVITDYKPDIIALGYDQTAFIQELEQFIKNSNLNILIVRIPSFKPEQYKSSIIKKQKI